MQAPLASTLQWTHGMQMEMAVLVGIGFGFVLERAGFGRADNLASIFYGRDFRVIRVMFTAIVTAMIGVYFLDLIGFMPIGDIGLLPTYWLPQLIGGLMLGAGFIIGGYCPGTSLVAVASGKIDAIFFVGGIFIGSSAFTLAYPSLEKFHESTSMGRVLMHEWMGIPSGVMVLLVALFAVGSLTAVTKIEAMVRKSLESKQLPEVSS